MATPERWDDVTITAGDTLHHNYLVPDIFDRLPPGTYDVSAMSALGLKKARATVSVRGKQTSPVTLTIDERAGSISGTVIDAANNAWPTHSSRSRTRAHQTDSTA